MKPRYYVYLVVIVILIILVSVLNNAGPSIESQIAASCLQNGGTFNIASKACVMPKQAAPAKPVSVSSSKPSTAVVAPKPVDRYYPIHVVKDGTSVYYSSTNADEIKVSNPPINSGMSTPFTVGGQARGSWYFEGRAPMLLTDANGKILAEGTINAQNFWKTNDFVAFLGVFSFPVQPTGSTGVLVVKNANPSGLPANAKAIEVLVKFK